MARTRLKLSGVASLAEARLAVEIGADLVVVEPGANADMAPDTAPADIALALPPGVCAVVPSRALTAGAIAQQVDAAAAGAVQLLRPLDASEHPGLKRIIRGRKIIQCLAGGTAMQDAAGQVGFADALEIEAPDALAIRDLPLPVFLAVPDGPAALSAALNNHHPFGIALRLPRRSDGGIDDEVLALLVTALRAADRA